MSSVKPLARSDAKPSNARFWILTGVTLVATGVLVASLWPAARMYGQHEAVGLVKLGEQGSGDSAALSFRMAACLDPLNREAAWRVAEMQLASDPKTALATLNRATGTGDSPAGYSNNFLSTYIRVQLENGNNRLAAATAKDLAKALAATDAQLITAALALGTAGEGSGIAALEPRLSSPEARQRVERIAAGKIALADELHASGLVRSSSALLIALPASAPRELRLARSFALSKTKASREAAAKHYDAYLAFMPADAAARLAYATVLEQLKQPDAASHQRSLAAKLQAGQP